MNALSGTLLFIANAPARWRTRCEIKLALVALGVGVVVMTLIERRLRQHERRGAGTDARPGLRALAATSLLLWVAAVVAGRLIAYAL